MGGKVAGTWIPEFVWAHLESLRLPTTCWNILLSILHRQYRFGGREARITIPQIMERTSLSRSTVKRALGRLVKIDLVRRTRRGVLRIAIPEKADVPAPSEGGDGETEGFNMENPSKVRQDEPFPTLCFLMKEQVGGDSTVLEPFTAKQYATVLDVWREASGLLGRDALALTVPGSGSADEPSDTFSTWLHRIVASKSKREAGRFVREMLSLRTDKRVIGSEWRGTESTR